MLACAIVAEGISTVDPAGNSMTRWRSHRIRWPPRLGSNDPREVIPHHPKGRLALSVCLKHVVVGPKLNVAAAHTLWGNAR